jgi:transcriptional regulator with XRE-family HTH domain
MSIIEDNTESRIAARIRLEREARSWSLSELAMRSGVSRAMIHRIETGASSPTAALLGKLSGAFGLSMSTLIARAELPSGQLLRRGEQPLWRDPKSGYLRRHVSPQNAFGLDIVEVELPAGTEVPMPAASYAFIRQMIWVLSGELVFAEGDARHALGPGDCLLLGPPSDCRFRNESLAPVRYAVIVQQAPQPG